jgi:membrane peptidoglycan carboxypeptidase
LGDPHFPFALESGRKKWAQSYALDILEEQVRPKAEDAFRRGDYSVATNLYESIQERLSRAEAKKLSLARKRSARDAKEILPVTDRPGCDV